MTTMNEQWILNALNLQGAMSFETIATWVQLTEKQVAYALGNLRSIRRVRMRVIAGTRMYEYCAPSVVSWWIQFWRDLI